MKILHPIALIATIMFAYLTLQNGVRCGLEIKG